jgi:hypothetical protein
MVNERYKQAKWYKIIKTRNKWVVILNKKNKYFLKVILNKKAGEPKRTTTQQQLHRSSIKFLGFLKLVYQVGM